MPSTYFRTVSATRLIRAAVAAIAKTAARLAQLKARYRKHGNQDDLIMNERNDEKMITLGLYVVINVIIERFLA